jgi:hypothetical protein
MTSDSGFVNSELYVEWLEHLKRSRELQPLNGGPLGCIKRCMLLKLTNGCTINPRSLLQSDIYLTFRIVYERVVTMANLFPCLTN